MLNRRKFLYGSSALAICHAHPTKAWNVHGIVSSPTGKTLIGGFDSTGFSYGFENQFKLSSGQFAASPFVWPAVLDTNGFPNNAPSNTLATAINQTVQLPAAWGTAPLVISWSGHGGVALSTNGFSNFAVTGTGITNQNSGNLIQILGTNVRITFNYTTAPSTSASTWGFPPGTYNGMSNLIFCRQSNEAAVLINNNLFNPDFITLNKALNPKIMRALDWSGANVANSSSFSQRAPASAASFLTKRFIPANWAGSVSGTDTYTLSAPSGWAGLVEGACVHFYVPSGQVNTISPPTLNVGGTGAITMSDTGPNNIAIGALVASSGSNTVVWTATYSAVYNYWIVTSGGLITNVPLEQHIALANAVNAHCWYNISHRYPASDGAAIAIVVQSSLNSQLNFYPELSNEIWNFVNTQTTFVQNIGTTLGITSSNLENLHFGYGLLARQMMGAITAAWTAPKSRLKRVIAAQAVGNISAYNTYRFQGADIGTVAQGGKVANSGSINTLWTNVYGAPNYTTSPNRPIDYADVISYATYYNGAQLPGTNVAWASSPYLGNAAQLQTGGPPGYTVGALGAADDYAAGGSTNISNALSWVDWDIRNGTFPGTNGQTLLVFNGASNGTGVYAGWESVAAGYDASRPGIGLSLLTIECYEGAFQSSGPTTATCTTLGISTAYGGVGGKVDNLIKGYLNSSLMLTLVNDMYNQFMGTATSLPNFGLLPHSTTFAWYVEQGPSQWSLLTGDTYTGPSSLGGLFTGTPFQSWNALVTIN